ncbi:hypothetical protein Tcan_03881 [Toxocara canis]|uniref:Uncharacterized protein n=1 Tax=Toxocara canis TaxID=6265 RepID=A0A0B2URZ7_TOXCA|nr:hypothetical protein Tcan_03881 [Toxocara canis]
MKAKKDGATKGSMLSGAVQQMQPEQPEPNSGIRVLEIDQDCLGVCALDESQYLPTSAIPFCGNPRSLVVKVGEAASCVYRMTKISVTKRHYRCSECETITEAASAKKWSKLITTCGSITSPHDP